MFPLDADPSLPAASTEVAAALRDVMVTGLQVRIRLEEACKQERITFAHYNVLRILHHAGRLGCPRSAIDARMLDPGADVTRLMTTLEKRGLARRERDARDRRIMLHRITEAGQQLVVTLEAAFDRVYAHYAQRMAPRDATHLSRICTGLFSDYKADDPGTLIRQNLEPKQTT